MWIAPFLTVLTVAACANPEEHSRPNTTNSTMSTTGRVAAPTATRTEVVMPIVVVHQVPSLTQERYEEVVRRLTNGKRRLESPSDVGVEGLLVHVAGQTRDGFRIIDVWESEEAFRRFRDVIGPIVDEVGVEEPPEIYPAHTFVSR